MADGRQDGGIPIYWDDLTPEKQAEIEEAFGENGNYDVFPIAILALPEQEEER